MTEIPDSLRSQVAFLASTAQAYGRTGDPKDRYAMENAECDLVNALGAELGVQTELKNAIADLEYDNEELVDTIFQLRYRTRHIYEQDQASERDGFYIMSIEHSLRNEPVTWWCPDYCGYTRDLNKAGIYTTEQINDTKHSLFFAIQEGQEVAIPVHIVKSKVALTYTACYYTQPPHYQNDSLIGPYIRKVPGKE